MPNNPDSWFRYQARRIARHLYWARTQGLSRLIEEDELNPLVRASRLLAGWRWRLAHRSQPPGARALFLVGVQRSGTNMLVRVFEQCPEVAVYNENSRAAFERFRLRPDPVIRRLVDGERRSHALFKPLCDSHRTAELLDHLGTRLAPRALWAYRAVDGRARSAVTKFGTSNLEVMRELAAGGGAGRWEAQGLSDDSRQLIAGFDWSKMDALSAAALFWYVRNRLYFELALDARDDVLLVSYEALLADPTGEIERIFAFAGVAFRTSLVAGLEPRRASGLVLDIHPRVRERCDQLAAALEAARLQPRPAA